MAWRVISKPNLRDAPSRFAYTLDSQARDTFGSDVMASIKSRTGHTYFQACHVWEEIAELLQRETTSRARRLGFGNKQHPTTKVPALVEESDCQNSPLYVCVCALCTYSPEWNPLQNGVTFLPSSLCPSLLNLIHKKLFDSGSTSVQAWSHFRVPGLGNAQRPPG